jgi:hypothetical protein
VPVLIPTRVTRDARYVRVTQLIRMPLIHRMHVDSLDYNSAGPQQEAGGHLEHGAQTGGALPFTPFWRSEAHRLMSDLAAGGIRLEMPGLGDDEGNTVDSSSEDEEVPELIDYFPLPVHLPPPTGLAAGSPPRGPAAAGPAFRGSSGPVWLDGAGRPPRGPADAEAEDQ